MTAHPPHPSQLRDEYDDMLDDLKALIGPYLPDPVREAALDRAKEFGVRLSDYAHIDAIFRAFRDNGMPTSHRHRAFQLMTDYVETQKAQRRQKVA